MTKIKVIIKRTDEELGHSTFISDSLENLKRTVGGYIETITVPAGFLPPELKATGDLVIICNEDGRMLNLPYNTFLFGFDLVGDVILAGVNGEDFADIPIEWANWRNYMNKFLHPKREAKQ